MLIHSLLSLTILTHKTEQQVGQTSVLSLNFFYNDLKPSHVQQTEVKSFTGSKKGTAAIATRPPK